MIFPLSTYISIVKIRRLNYIVEMPTGEKKPYHHGDLREALIAAAELAVSELPIEQVSLREIARRAGVSHAAPKHHFGTLGALFAEIAARGFTQFVADLAQAADRQHDQSPESRLKAMSRAYLRFASGNRAAYGLMFGKRAEIERSPNLNAASFAAWSQLETEVANIVGPARASAAALMIWSSCHGLAMLMLESQLPPHLDPHVSIESITAMGIAGLKAEA
jgi:AcrR family transcriptional regulator